jgi:hypothetical protein
MMHCKGGENHVDAARQLADRLFSEEDLRLGFRESLGNFEFLSTSEGKCKAGNRILPGTR